MAEVTNTTEINRTVENNGGDPQSGTDNNVNAVSTNEGAEKTFTQKELDDIVKQRLNRATKDMPSKDELNAFREWQNSQKTSEQLTAEKITAAENSKAEAVRRAEAAEAKCTAYSKGVSAEAVEDVIALAMAKTSDSKSIEQAIDEVIEKYPSFCSSSKSGITTGVDFSGGSNNKDGITAAFLARNPNIKI